MMARTGLDAVLRHLGAAYYGSLHGRAARSEAARALDAGAILRPSLLLSSQAKGTEVTAG